MALRRTLRRTLLAAAVLSASVLTTPSAHAAPLPPACQDALLKTLDKFPVTYFTVPEKAKTALFDEVGALSEADQEAFTQPACTAWNNWATANGQAVATDLDNRYQKAGGGACVKFAASSVGTLKKFAPQIPEKTRGLEKVAKKVWKNAMRKLSTEATNADCRKAYDGAKAGW
ncbi:MULTISPECIES: hypothetical protein [Streptomyces]|uniref:Small secreted protein n=1 Tax=Streptomyces evansiae TaxID=3075535 RepID=A0ABU2R7D5_9ACTN|nr:MULTISPECIES: hypothetical protein [unclassified Streptomyces]EFL03769.1 conserved hypothetical protein [Streptomyces sp. SPB78]MDT0412614.1 hypothetical protein [Streptomyces sp. DSM 41979]MYQ60701.1 hypothetical protein [Streptomyces sp. SID4926]WEH30966.1 hypothetical protein P0D76_28545 [Streptomyces sp. AM 3-1-1]SCE54394.1 hypothetical protein GA0115252_16077 [Streptomyces sp. DfronAA-171]